MSEATPRKLEQPVIFKRSQRIFSCPQLVDCQRNAVESSPDNVGPTGAVPKSTEQHGHHHVDRDAKHRVGVVAGGYFQRQENVISEPLRQRDMPSSPEFSDVAGTVWHLEIIRETEPQKPPTANGHVRVAG